MKRLKLIHPENYDNLHKRVESMADLKPHHPYNTGEAITWPIGMPEALNNYPETFDRYKQHYL